MSHLDEKRCVPKRIELVNQEQENNVGTSKELPNKKERQKYRE